MLIAIAMDFSAQFAAYDLVLRIHYVKNFIRHAPELSISPLLNEARVLS